MLAANANHYRKTRALNGQNKCFLRNMNTECLNEKNTSSEIITGNKTGYYKKNLREKKRKKINTEY